MKEPESRRVFEKRVPSIVTEHHIRKVSHSKWFPFVKPPGRQDAGGTAPEPHRPHHVLADAKGQRRVVRNKNVRVVRNPVINLLKPACTRRESLVPPEHGLQM